MTCPSLLRRTAVGGAREAGPWSPTSSPGCPAGPPRCAPASSRTTPQPSSPATWSSASSPAPSTPSSSSAWTAASEPSRRTSSAPIASTLLANELHRRLTFHAGQQVSWFTAQWEGGGLAGVGLVATSLALAGVHALIGPVGAAVQLCLIAAVTGAIGLVRFVALRSWVFAPALHRD